MLFFSTLLLAAAPVLQDGNLITQGRALLEAGKPAEAEALFTQADEASGGKITTRIWVLRAWMEQGRINDSLNAIDELEQAERESPGGDYIYGMASYLRGKGHLASGVDSGTIGFAFEDAKNFLKSATAADPELYGDAWLPLGEASWYAQDLETAASACAKAIERRPRNGNAFYVLGRVQFSQFSAMNADESKKDQAKALLDETIRTFQKGVRALGKPEQPVLRTLAAKCHNQLGNAYLWKENKDEAALSFADAMGWDPSIVDFGGLWSRFYDGNSAMGAVQILDSGSKKFVANWGEETSADALLLWWLGYANFTEREDEAAEAAYLKTVKKWPAYMDAWYYIATSRYRRQDYFGALDAFKKNWEAGPENLVANINTNAQLNLNNIGFIIGKCAEAGRNADAAFLCEVRVGANPEYFLYWNDLGLFCRDTGDGLSRRGKKEDKEEISRLYERALEAYVRAREIAPQYPHLLNDGAVILDYCLDRELDRALEMYDAALKQATELLDAGLEGYDLDVATIAKRDAANNARALRRRMKEKEEE